MRVLYVEDERVLGRIVKESLEQRGCEVHWHTDQTAAAVAIADASDYDIAVLDVQLPGSADGFDIGRAIRKDNPDLPIIFLTARVEAKDALAGFAAGGNDYVRKPFSMEELLVRMRQLIERGPSHFGENTAPAAPPANGSEVYALGALRFDYHNLRLGQHTLSHREAELLRYFYQYRDRAVIERRELLLALWGDDGFFHSRNLDVYVRRLRKYLEGSGVRIHTLRGVGYRLSLNETTIEGP